MCFRPPGLSEERSNVYPTLLDVAVVCHGGVIESILDIVKHQPFALGTGGEILDLHPSHA